MKRYVSPSPCNWLQLPSAVLKILPSNILIGDPNKCIKNVKNPKPINSHKSIVLRVIAFIPPQKARPITPHPATRTTHVESRAIFCYTLFMLDYDGSLARVFFQNDIVVPNLFSKSPLTDHQSIYYNGIKSCDSKGEEKFNDKFCFSKV